MSLPEHLHVSARHIWNIFFDWRKEKLRDYQLNRASELRGALPNFYSTFESPKVAIIVDAPLPSIEYINLDSHYVLHFCTFQQINVTDPQRALAILRWLLAQESEHKSVEEMELLIDNLHSDLWLADANWVATRIAMCRGASHEEPLLSDLQYMKLYRELRTALDNARNSADLDSWWYALHCLTPRLRLAWLHAGAMGEEEDATFSRFFEEVFVDFQSFMRIAMDGWFRGDERPISHALFFHPFGRADPEYYRPERDYRFNLPSFWYDTVVASRKQILEMQNTMLYGEPPTSQADSTHSQDLPHNIDHFSPHILAAMIFLGGIEQDWT